MQALKERYGDKAIVFDYESVFEECDNMAQRERRRAFYLRNGYLETGWFVRANGVELIVASSKEDFDINDYVAMLEEWAKDAPDSAEGVEMPEIYRR
ncbi:MAG: hypothetical protein Q4B54_03935 [Coriobacteriales bacterium]|nr:hypothetical protein [Coriobacteriales bacterium]